MTYEQLFKKMHRNERYNGGVEKFAEQMAKIRSNLDESDRLYAISNPNRVGGLQDKWDAIMSADVFTNSQIQDFMGLSERKLEAAQKSYQLYLTETE